MSVIHGRALQLRFYLNRDVTLGDVIPDAPMNYASLKVFQYLCDCSKFIMTLVDISN
jgi:hypothetical protein